MVVFAEKTLELLDIITTTMHTIPTDNGFATQPPNYPVFTTEWSPMPPRSPTRPWLALRG